MLQTTVAYCGMKSIAILKDKIGHSTQQNNAALDTCSVRLVHTPDSGEKSGVGWGLTTDHAKPKHCNLPGGSPIWCGGWARERYTQGDIVDWGLLVGFVKRTVPKARILQSKLSARSQPSETI